MRVLFFLAAFVLLLGSACNQNNKRLTTVDGYEYILHKDDSEAKANPGDFMFFHLQIRNGDSIVYTTREESPDPPVIPFPAEEQPGRKVFPIEHVLQVMGVGDSATVFIPIDSMPQKPTGFEDATEMIYDVVMVDIKSAEVFESFQEEQRMEAEAKTAGVRENVMGLFQAYKAGDLDERIQSTASGLNYVIIQQGEGPGSEPGDLVNVDYFGMLESDATEFDNSFSRGQPYPMAIGRGGSIPGFEEGVALLNEGGEAFVIIPPELGYGAAGSPPMIPADAALIFYIQIQKVQKAN